VFELGNEDGIVRKVYEDGFSEPNDMANYALHHLERYRKTNSVDENVKMAFADLTPEELGTSFITHTSPEQRDQLMTELRHGTLMEITSWLAFNAKHGCVKCAPFLARQYAKPCPDRPIRWLSSEQVTSFAVRERNMAFKILKEASELEPDTNVVAFVGREHMMPVAKQMSDILNNP
jgi:hypothetical protein